MQCQGHPIRRPPCPYLGSEVYEAERALAWCRGEHSLSEPSLVDLCRTTGRSFAAEADELPHLPTHRTLVQSPDTVAGVRQEEWFTSLLSSTETAGEARPDRLSEWFLLPSRERRMGDRPTLVLDLDETLVSSVEGFASPTEVQEAPPHKVMIMSESQTPSPGKGAFRLVWRDGGCLEVRPRPGLGDFLAFVREHFEVILWTAGTGDYARAVLTVIDDAGETFEGRVVARDRRWFRPHEDGQGYAKDLRRLGRSLQRTVLVDNSPIVCRRNPENCIVVPDWIGAQRGRSDAVLPGLRQVLNRWLASRQPVGTFLASCSALLRTPPSVPGIILDCLLYHLVGESEGEKPAADAASPLFHSNPLFQSKI
eukprot:Hpha_TRINITY_DN14681_c0_g3::TRINITY_DN14681_c0_g3_i1::g.47785::m.47785/K15731/CTDSP; carboxy-terminal domain RNA polymerase II polypeptide A small phosphatase